MLRKGIVALCISVVATGISAAGEKPGLLQRFIQGPKIGQPHRKATSYPVRHAVVQNAQKQAPKIRQTSSKPQPPLIITENNLQPIPQSAPSLEIPVTKKVAQAPAKPLPSVESLASQTVANPAPTPQTNLQQQPIQPVGFHRIGRGHGRHLPMIENRVPMGGGSNAALYPAPRGGIPPQVGGAAIVHHALHPHEMLYPHRYKAMYGPYYYKVHGKWIVTPWGTWSNERWKLQGTQVDVNYKSHISPFAKFHPPVIR